MTEKAARSLRGLMIVRSPKGKLLHVVRAVGDGGTGRTVCALVGRAWTIVPDAVPDCPRCKVWLSGARLRVCAD